jgi:hypothetical protein
MAKRHHVGGKAAHVKKVASGKARRLKRHAKGVAKKLAHKA